MMNNRRETLYQRIYDPTVFSMLMIIITLCTISVITLYSASNGNLNPWALKNGINSVVFIGIMLFIMMADLRSIYDLSYLIYFICIALLVVAELVGYNTMGAQRWIKIGAINIQPSEFAKIGVILALSRYFQYFSHHKMEGVSFMIIPILIVLVPVLLILKQPNLGTAIILIIISSSIYFVTGISKWFFIIPGIISLCMMPIAWNLLHDYQKKRILTFLSPEDDLLGSGYNIAQSKIAIGAGGFSGKGFMHGTQSQLSFLPEKHTDFIFTLLAEEWGFIGCMVVMILYIALLFICYRVAFNSLHDFGKLATVGVATMIFSHIFINMGMISGILPVVGTPMPFLSYGGSNIATNLIGIGLVLSIDRSRKQGFVKLR